jgi:hypothetical protein
MFIKISQVAISSVRPAVYFNDSSGLDLFMTIASGQENEVQARITQVGRDLGETFCKLLDAIPGGPHRPQWLAQQLGVNAVLTSRLLKAAQQRDPLVVAHVMPGPEPLRRLLRAAEKQKINRRLIQDAADAVDRFQQLIDAEAGDRSALDAIISGWLPDARAKVELIAKQSVFRGVSHLLGTSCEVAHYTMMLHPSAPKGDRADQLLITNIHGLRRVRPGASINYDTIHSSSPMLTIEGESVDSIHGLLLEQFCSLPVPQLSVVHRGDIAQYTLLGQDVGVRSAVDLVHATYLPGNKQVQRQFSDPPRTTPMAIGIDPPSRTFLFDVILHRDIFPKQTPRLDVYRTAGAVASPQGMRDEMHRLDILESIQPLGQGIAAWRSADSPKHHEIMAHVCARRGWDPAHLRGYRCRMDYPMYSTEVVISFDLPSNGAS